MVKVKEDLTGMKFGKLIVLKQVEDRITPSGKHRPMWLCQCECGSKPIVVGGDSLKAKHTVSCGCKKREDARILGNNKKKTNKYNLDGDYAIGYTSKNEEYWVDKEDVNILSNYCWFYNDRGYVVANDIKNNTVIYLHRLVMGVLNDSDNDVDHKTHPPRNQHKIDNRKSNLELVTRSENCMNSHIRTNNSSGVVGVDWSDSLQKWRARICINYKQIHLGIFDNKEDAIMARKNAEVQYFGEHRYDANNK